MVRECIGKSPRDARSDDVYTILYSPDQSLFGDCMAMWDDFVHFLCLFFCPLICNFSGISLVMLSIIFPFSFLWIWIGWLGG
jgi:hypothetical protein